MLDRVFKEVRSSIADGSPDAERVAALLIREFQHGANTEANLMTAFDGDVDLVSRLSRLKGNALYGWEGDGGTVTSISPSKGLIP